MAVSGPGLGDLLTEGPDHGVFDLDHVGGTHLEEQINRLEEMLLRMQSGVGSQDTLAQSPTRSPKFSASRRVPESGDMLPNRTSASTVVVDSHNTIHPDDQPVFDPTVKVPNH